VDGHGHRAAEHGPGRGTPVGRAASRCTGPSRGLWDSGPVPEPSGPDAPAGATVWFTGLSGAGKSTLASGSRDRLTGLGYRAYHLDGDVLRTGLNADLGYDPASRDENVRRAGEVALILASTGITVLAAFISPFEAAREQVRRRHAAAGVPFFEVHISTPLETCVARDPKHIYSQARSGRLTDVSGLDGDYEVPPHPDLRIECVGDRDELIGTVVDRIVAWHGSPLVPSGTR